jgi:hypothetical protein
MGPNKLGVVGPASHLGPGVNYAGILGPTPWAKTLADMFEVKSFAVGRVQSMLSLA